MSRVGYWILPLVILISVVFLIQFSQPLIIGADGYLHGRMSLFISSQGFLKTLPQAHFSWFATRFSDKDFVYHLYLIPFTSMFGYINGTKMGALLATGILFGTTLSLVNYYIRRRVLIVVSLLLLLSPLFLRDTAEARPFVFAITFTLIGIHFLTQKQYGWIFFVSLLYGMVHLSAWVLPGMAIVILLYDWLTLGKGNVRLVGASFLGYVISFFIHPNFSNNIFYTYLNGILVPWYAAKTGVLELGAEFFPLTTQEILHYFPMLVGSIVLLAGLWIIHQAKIRRETVVWTIAVVLFSVLGFVSRRNLTHLYPIFIVWLTLIVDDWLVGWKSLEASIRHRVSLVVSMLAMGLLAYSFWQMTVELTRMLTSDRIYAEHFLNVANYLSVQVPKGSRIFHSNWSDSQYLIGLAPDFEYFVTLDPIYMYNWNPSLYALYRQVAFGQHPDPYAVLTNTFGVHNGYVGKNYFGGFIDQIRKDKRFTIIFEDELGIVFSL